MRALPQGCSTWLAGMSCAGGEGRQVRCVWHPMYVWHSIQPQLRRRILLRLKLESLIEQVSVSLYTQHEFILRMV